MFDALPHHWPEYLIEGTLLGLFMIVACVAVVLLHHPASPIARSITKPLVRRVVIGVLMGLTAIALIYSPWGQRSGAHINPGTTLTFLVLKKVHAWDALFYVMAQFAGGLVGVGLAAAVLGGLASHKHVNYAATLPGKPGIRIAWLAEFAIAFIMMSTVLWTSNSPATSPYAGIFAGVLVATFIAVESPLSGMSMNAARSLGSALPARAFRGLWIYFTAPPLAMLLAAGMYVAIRGADRVYCCKLAHGDGPCIFDCHINELRDRPHPSHAAGIQRSAHGAP